MFGSARLLSSLASLALLSVPCRAAPLGLVLSGGGAKGAYQIGVWKALCEKGLEGDVVAISGTSVGAINAALFALVPDPVRCVELWREVSATAFSVNAQAVDRELTKTLDDATELRDEMKAERRRRIRRIERMYGRPPTQEELDEIDGDLALESRLSMGAALLLRLAEKISDATDGKSKAVGFCDSKKFRDELLSALPDKWRRDSPQVYVTAVEKASSRARVFSLRNLPKAEVVSRIMASAAIPGVFDSVEIDGEMFIDGGFEAKGGDNTPVQPILDRHPEVRNIIVVSLVHKADVLGPDVSRRSDGVTVTTIRPSQDIAGRLRGLQGIFDVTPEQANRLVQMGHDDAIQALRAIKLPR